MTILTILVTIQNTQSKTYNNIWPKGLSYLYLTRKKIKGTLSELKTWLLSCSYPLAIIEKAFFNAKLQGPAPKKEKIVIPFVSTHYSNFDSKSISSTAKSLLSNVEDKKLKRVFDKCKVIHALKQHKNLLRLLSQPKVQNCISKKYDLCRYECKDPRCNV